MGAAGSRCAGQARASAALMERQLLDLGEDRFLFRALAGDALLQPFVAAGGLGPVCTGAPTAGPRIIHFDRRWLERSSSAIRSRRASNLARSLAFSASARPAPGDARSSVDAT
jgi:hypothetical protein